MPLSDLHADLLHKYYVKNDQLYYVAELNSMSDIYLVENCGTEYTMWVTGTYLREEVEFIARNRRSRIS